MRAIIMAANRPMPRQADQHNHGVCHMITLRVNGVARSFNGDGNMPLLWYLRDELVMVFPKSQMNWICENLIAAELLN